MKAQLLAFSYLREQLGFHLREVEFSPEETPRQLLQRLALAVDGERVRVALDAEYGDWDAPLGDCREIALIPPVSGG